MTRFVITLQKYPQNLRTPPPPPPNSCFSESPKHIEIQSFEPKKIGPGLRIYENIRVPPGVKWT